MNKQQPLILFYRQRNCLWWRGFEFSAIARVALDVRLGCLQDVPAEPDTQQLIDAVNTFFTNVGILELKPPFWKIIPTPRWRAYIRALDQISRWVCIADPGKIFQHSAAGRRIIFCFVRHRAMRSPTHGLVIYLWSGFSFVSFADHKAVSNASHSFRGKKWVRESLT